MSIGLRTVAPYVLGVATLAALIGGALFAFRRAILSWCSTASADGEPWDGAARLLLSFALFMVSWLASTEVTATLGLVVGLPVGVWCGAVAAMVALAFLWFSVGEITSARRIQTVGLLVAIFLVAVVAALVMSGHFFDVSWDGNTAHQPAVVELAGGWNPLRQPHPDSDRIAQWGALEFYPKGAWIRGAVLYRLIGVLEQAKAPGLLLLVAAVCAWAALLISVARNKQRAALVLALTMVANPVALAQAFTFMVDGQIASLFSLSLAMCGLLFTRLGRWPVAAGLAGSLLMLANCKFTGLVYAVAIGLGLALAVVIVRPSARRRVVAGWVGGALLAAVCLVGFNPYAVNLLQGRPIFYPIVGAGSGDIMTNNSPGDFVGRNSFERLFRSLYSEAAHQIGSSPEAVTTRLKVPFTVHTNEIRPYLAPETRIAGFGPLFGGILLLAIVGVVLLMASRGTRRDRVVWGSVYAAAFVMATVLVNPEGWWARYAPQLWLVPVLVSVALVLRSDARPARMLGWAMCVLLLGNAAFVGTISFANTVNARVEIGAALDEIATFPRGAQLQLLQFETTGTKLDTRGISYRVVSDEPTLTGGVTIPYTTSIASPIR